MLLARLPLGESREALAAQALAYLLDEYPALRALSPEPDGAFFERALAAARESGDEQMLADVVQVKALHQDLRPAVFQPFPRGVFDDRALPGLLLQCERLPARVAAEAVNRGICAWWGNPSAEPGENSVSVLLGRVGVYLSASRVWWARYGRSPLWIHTAFRYRIFAGFSEAELQAVRQAFRRAGGEVFGGSEFGIPLIIPAEADEQDVLDSLVQQLERLRRELGDTAVAAAR